jgi:hypothetical protein
MIKRMLFNWYVYIVLAIVLIEELVFWLRERQTLTLLLTATGFSLTVVAIAYASEITFP